MRNLVIGIVIGFLLGGTFAWAATEFYLVSANGTPVGTASNPINVIGV